MKKYILFVISIVIFNGVFAQKFGYVDSQYILEKMPEYQEAQKAIEILAKGWQDEILKKYTEARKLESKLKAEEVLLTKEMYDERKQEIADEWKAIEEYQQKIFGFKGLYFLKKKEMVKPVQDKVFEAIDKVAKRNRLQIVFDKSGELVMIYTDPVHDYTDFVLEELDLVEKQGVDEK